MIGWEYPPHNSGGLGVACDGLTRALAARNTQIYFTLPYPVSGGFSHLKMLPCHDDTWSPDDIKTGGVFSAYGDGRILGADKTVDPDADGLLDSSQLRALPQSELDARVTHYADLVAERARPLHKTIDLIHAHDWMSFPAAQKMARESKKPFVAHVHSTEYDRVPHGYGSSFIHQVEQHGLDQAKHIIAVSHFTKYLLVRHYDIPESKISVVHNGIDPLADRPEIGNHHFASNRPVVVFMGRLTMQKGGEYFLKTAKEVIAHIPNALFVVAGSGDLYHQLLFSAAYDQLSAHVLFSGFVRDKQRDLLLNRADVFVMPSISEPFGLVALEAAQRHTPVIVSRQSGVAEVLPSAIQVDFWDTTRMSQSIVSLLRDPGYAHSVIQGQLTNMEALSWQSSARKVLDLYERIFQRPIR